MIFISLKVWFFCDQATGRRSGEKTLNPGRKAAVRKGWPQLVCIGIEMWRGYL